MNLSAPFIRRPIGTLLLTVGLFLTGVAAFFVLPVAPLPQVDFPTIQVSANLSGASPETMASSVTSPLERRLRTIAGITELTSDSDVGSSRITMQFDLSRSVDGAAREVQAAINAARADLPATLRTNPTYRKVNPADSPIMILALTSKTRTPAEVYDSVSSLISQRLAQVPGVGEVELGGGSLPAVRIDMNPLALARYGISLEDVRTAISSTNANRPRGWIENDKTAWQIETDPAGRKAADYRGIIIAWRDGIGVRLSDVATVWDGPQDIRTTGLFNGERAVTVVIRRQPGANIIAAVDGVTEQLPALRAAIPADVTLEVASDRTKTIRASLHEVELTLVISALLVVLVVSIFLRSLRATIVPFVAVVVSISGTLGVMSLLGFSLNNLSLMALTVATGFVVDDAIVVLENIMRHIEEGVPKREAAFRGAREVGFTVMSISVSLVAVFIPLLFMGGLIGRLFGEFAITMTVAVMISLVISLTTTPMLAAIILPDHPRPNRFTDFSERMFDRLHRVYEKSLDWALANRAATLLLFFGAIAFNVALYYTVPAGFFPRQDTGMLQGGLRADRSVSFVVMREKLGQIVEIIRKDPGIESVTAFTGGARAGGGFMFVSMKPRGERDGAEEVIQRLRPKLARVTGISVFLNPVQDVQIGGRQSNASYQYALKGDSYALVTETAQKIAAAMKTEPMLTDVDVDTEAGAAEVYMTIDRDKARRLGIDQETIDSILYNGFGQRQVQTIYSGLNQYRVVLGVESRFAQGPDALREVYLPTAEVDSAATTIQAAGVGASRGSGSDDPTGQAVNATARVMTPLSTIARWEVRATAAQVEHQDGVPATQIGFATAPGVSLSEASTRIREIAERVGMPDSISGTFAGTAQAFQESASTMPLLIGAALVTIYIVLGILYESAIHPLTVLSTIPAAGLGAFAALGLFGMELDLIAMIGLILLIGIVKKNAIMIIDFALTAERERGLSSFDAIREASLLRFRPILMTTLAAGLGALPLAIGFGDGAELRRPLGFTIIGGLIASQFITLLTTPVLYLALDRFRRRPSPASSARMVPA